MFHIANKVYFEYEFKHDHMSPFMMASKDYEPNTKIFNAEMQAPTFEALLEDNYDGDINKFWTSIISNSDKLVVYLDSDTIANLQVQYWRSIFEVEPSIQDIYFLHKTYVESIRLSAYNNITGDWDSMSGEWSQRNLLGEIHFKTLEEITDIYNANGPVPALQNMDKSTVGIEYLLADYFADKLSPYSETLMERVKYLTWDNWLDELEHLKYELLSGTIDIGKLDPTLNITVGNVESELAKSNILSWTVDPLFNEDIDYIRQTYDHTIFNPCWTLLADQWGIPYDDMDELNAMINNDEYENLLLRDINRNYGSSYTRTRFMNKANQTLATWVYDRVREDQIKDLHKFKLKR